MDWKIIYSDLSTFSSDEGSPYDIPSNRHDGVQVIIKRDPTVGRFFVARVDYYWWDHQRGQWFGGDIGGKEQHLRKSGPNKVLNGEHITRAEYEACVALAEADPHFPIKSAREERETF